MAEFVEQDELFTVVAIPDSFTLVIDAGNSIGVKKGDRFRILGEPVEIRHPSTGETLGVLGESKDVVVVSDVHEKMCVCKSNSYITGVPGLLDISMRANLEPLIGKRTMQPLDVNENEVGTDGDIDAPISIGDKAKWLRKTTED